MQKFPIGDKRHFIMTHDQRHCCCGTSLQVEYSLFLLSHFCLFGIFFGGGTNFLSGEKRRCALIKGRQALLNISLQPSKWKNFFLYLFFFSHEPLWCKLAVSSGSCSSGGDALDRQQSHRRQNSPKLGEMRRFLPSVPPLALQNPGSVPVMSSLLGSSWGELRRQRRHLSPAAQTKTAARQKWRKKLSGAANR